MNEISSIEKQFIEENGKLDTTRQKFTKKIGCPYTKQERQKRLDEVYKLYFMFGYPAKKIAELMKVNRHAIESDIKLIYKKLGEQIFTPDSNGWITRQFERLEFQRSRLLESLYSEDYLDRKLSIERLILEIDNRIMHYTMNAFNNEIVIWSRVSKMLNDFAGRKKLGTRWYSPFELIEITAKQQERIDKILKE